MSVENVCRTCLAPNAAVDVNSNESGIPLIHLLSRCCNVNMVADGLPDVVCDECCSKLVQFRQFGARALRVHHSLLKLIKNSHAKDDTSKVPAEDNAVLDNEIGNRGTDVHKTKMKKAKRKILKIDIGAAYKCTGADENCGKANESLASNREDSDVDLSRELSNKCQTDTRTQDEDVGRSDGVDICDAKESRATLESGEREPSSEQRRRRRANETSHVCERCGYRAADHCSLRVHMRFHTGERPFPCTQCDKTFAIASNLKAHLRVHSGERPFVCELCGRAFNAAASLRGHARTHSGERPYACADCPRRFAMLSNLRQHSRVHSGLKPYACDICSKPFSSSSDARAHRRTHTGERPYACAACPRRFALSSNLRAHARTHQAAPAQSEHSCAHCGQQFAHKSVLSAHVRCHTAKSAESAPHACGVCGKRFARKCNLAVHKRKKKSCSGAQQQSTNEIAEPKSQIEEPSNGNVEPSNQIAEPTNQIAVRTDQSQTLVPASRNVIVQSQQILTSENKFQFGRPPLRTSIAVVQIAGNAVAVRAEPQTLSAVTAVLPLTIVPVSILR